MQRLTDLDAALLAAETPNQHAQIVAVLVGDGTGVSEPPFELVIRRLRERFALVPVLRRQLVSVPFGPPVWVEAETVDLERHVHHVVLRGGGDLNAVAARVGTIAGYPLPRDRPLWEAWVIEGMDDGRFALVLKVHHSLVDGVSGVTTILPFFDLDPNPTHELVAEAWDAEPAPTAASLWREALVEARHRPVAIGRSLRRLAASAIEGARSANGAALPLACPRVVWNDALTPRRSVAFTHIKMDDVKAIRVAHGGTVNDVVVALVAGALRRYLDARGELPDRQLVAAVPVSEREAHDGLDGNRISLMLYGLPVHVADPLARMREATRSAELAKDLYDRVGVGLFADVAAMVPFGAVGPAMRVMSRFGFAKRLPPVANLIVSNVRGPGFPLYAAGVTLEHMLPLGPLMEGVGLGATVVSYRDHIDFAFVTCPDLVPDVGALTAGIDAEVAALLALS